jgi:hypothetical protein
MLARTYLVPVVYNKIQVYKCNLGLIQSRVTLHTTNNNTILVYNILVQYKQYRTRYRTWYAYILVGTWYNQQRSRHPVRLPVRTVQVPVRGWLCLQYSTVPATVPVIQSIPIRGVS